MQNEPPGLDFGVAGRVKAIGGGRGDVNGARGSGVEGVVGHGRSIACEGGSNAKRAAGA